jgi:hypothetical protein
VEKQFSREEQVEQIQPTKLMIPTSEIFECIVMLNTSVAAVTEAERAQLGALEENVAHDLVLWWIVAEIQLGERSVIIRQQYLVLSDIQMKSLETAES